MTDETAEERLAHRIKNSAVSLIPLLVMMETESGDHTAEALAAGYASAVLRDELADALLSAETLILSRHTKEIVVDLDHYAKLSDHLVSKAGAILPILYQEGPDDE